MDALPAMVHPMTGRVHASFNQVVTATGRLSSSDPNLQNIPVRTEEGREIRSALCPARRAGRCWRPTIRRSSCGYWPITRATRVVRGIPARRGHPRPGGQPGQQRPPGRSDRGDAAAGEDGKFRRHLWTSAAGLARRLGIERDAAAEFIDDYFRRYPGIEQFLVRVLAECRRRGYVKTILGRRRAIRGVRAEARAARRNLAERTAVNTVIQGSAADLIKQAMIAIHKRLGGRAGGADVLQIHDELIFETSCRGASRAGRAGARGDGRGRRVAGSLEGRFEGRPELGGARPLETL